MYEDSPKMKVKCNVDSCLFNAEHRCHAYDLEVNAIGDGVADYKEGTCCATFINRVNAQP